jgi:hypothetical protein
MAAVLGTSALHVERVQWAKQAAALPDEVLKAMACVGGR